MQKSGSTQPPGLYRKYEVHRTDGRDRPGGDPSANRLSGADLTRALQTPHILGEDR